MTRPSDPLLLANLEILIRRRWLFVLPLLLAVAAAVGTIFLIPPVYESEVQLLVEEKKVSNPLLRNLAVSTTLTTRLATMKAKLLSRDQLLAVIDELDLAAAQRSPDDMEELLRELQESITVQIGRSGLIELTVQSSLPLLAQRTAAVLAERLMAENEAQQRHEVDDATAFIESQLAVYQRRLSESEARIRDFNALHQIDLAAPAAENLDQLRRLPMVPANFATTAPNVHVARLIEFQEEQVRLEIRLAEIPSEIDQLDRRLKTLPTQLVDRALEETSPTYHELRLKLAEDEVALARLLNDATDEHAMVRSMRRSIERTKKELASRREVLEASGYATGTPEYRAIVERKSELEQELAAGGRRMESIRARSKEVAAQVAKLPELELEKSRLLREFEVNSGVYEMLLERLETARITRDLEQLAEGTRFDILRPASLPRQPIWPQPIPTLLLGFVMGCMLGGGLVAVAEFLDESIHTVDDASEHLDLPVVGATDAFKPTRIETEDAAPAQVVDAAARLGRDGKLDRASPAEGGEDAELRLQAIEADIERMGPEIIALRAPRSPVAEQFRILATNLATLRGDRSGGVVMVTSSRQGEGKTVSSCNLALTIAKELPGRAVLIDGDLRRPQVHSYLGMARHPGLTDLLTGRATVEQIVRPTVLPSLSVIPCGAPTDQSGALLRSPLMAKLLARLRRESRWVLVDAPPTISISDSLVIGRLVDAALLVVEANSTQKRKILHAKSTLVQGRVPLAGVIVTKQVHKLPRYFDHYYEYYEPESVSGERDRKSRRHRRPV